MARKQQLIHLHNISELTASAVKTAGMVKGEIAVRHAATNIDSELYTLNNNGDIVKFPSVEKVESLISVATSTDIDTLQKDVTELKATVDGYSSTGTTVKAAIEKVKGDLQNEIGTINGLIGSGVTGSDITTELAAVKNTANAASEKADANATAISGINNALGSLTGANAVPNAINAAKTKVVAATGSATTDFLTVSDNSKDNPTSGVTYTLTLKDVASAKGLSDLKSTVDGNKSNIETLLGLHATGETGYLTVAEQVNARVAEVINGAPEAFDTLKEIADWIGTDTTGAAQMATDITALKNALSGYISSGAVQNAFTTVNGKINTINSVLKGLSGESAVSNAINAAKTTITTGETGGVKVEIVNTGISDGHTNYKISGVGLATSENLSTLSGTVDTLKTNLSNEVTNRTNADKAINDKIGDGFDSTNTVTKKVAAAKTTITTANTGLILISSSADTDGHINYTISANGIASDSDLDTLDKAAVKSGEINVDDQKFTGTFASNKLSFNLSTLVIDCGEY